MSWDKVEERFKKWLDSCIDEAEKEDVWYYAEDFEDNHDEDDDLEEDDEE